MRVWMNESTSEGVKEETDRTGWVLKAGPVWGRTVDCEMCAQYPWKRHTNWKSSPLPRTEEPQGSCLDSLPPKKYPNYLCN